MLPYVAFSKDAFPHRQRADAARLDQINQPASTNPQAHLLREVA